MSGFDEELKSKIERADRLSNANLGVSEILQGAGISQTIVYETLGPAHPLYKNLEDGIKSNEWDRALAASRAVIDLYQMGGLRNPRLSIAKEIETDILEVAQQQVRRAELASDVGVVKTQLAIAAFLAGAALEDALRRLCASNGVSYDAQRSSLSKLQSALYKPSAGVEVIGASSNKMITAWGDTRNRADHGKFEELTISEVSAMVIGVKGFISDKLPD